MFDSISKSQTVPAVQPDRNVVLTYQDPVDLIWTATARSVGISIVRDSEVFAAWDGKGTLRIGTPESLDADDSLAQMVLHELCHALVAGPAAFALPDWGVDIENPSDIISEYAALRLQAAIADGVGMRNFFASTTNFRSYYDQIGDDPLASPLQILLDGSEIKNDLAAVELARCAWRHFESSAWYLPITGGMQATRNLANALCDFASAGQHWPENSLWLKDRESRRGNQQGTDQDSADQ